MSRRTALAAGWTLAVFAACSVPGSALPPGPFLSFDKVIHVVMFAGVAVLWRRALGGRDLAILVGCVVFALAIEWWQQLPFVGRTADPADAVADALGALLGLALVRFWTRRERGPTAE